MSIETVIVFAFLAFMFVGGMQMVQSVRRGRELCRELERRFPAEYEAMEKPLPGFFFSVRRNAYMRLIMQREYQRLDDAYLVERFTALRRSEVSQLVFLLAGFAVLGAVALWYEFIYRG